MARRQRGEMEGYFPGIKRDPIEAHAKVRPPGKLEGLLDRPNVFTPGTQKNIVLVPPNAAWDPGAFPIIPPNVNAVTLVKLGGADQLTRDMSVTLDIDLLVTAISADFLSDNFARVFFGSGTARHMVDVDLGPVGQSIHVHASYLEVIAYAWGNGNALAKCNVGYAGATRGWPPTRTISSGRVIAVAGQGYFPIPPFSTAVRVQRNCNLAFSNPQVRVTLWDGLYAGYGVAPAVAGGRHLHHIGANASDPVIRLPATSQTLEILNTDPADQIDSVRLIFELGV